MDFLWHSVGEKEKEVIKKEAKKIMDSFAKALSKVEKTGKKEFVFVQREKQTRQETKAECDSEFRKFFLDNVPKKDGDWVKAEKGAWK